jgi:hypothetical protein
MPPVGIKCRAGLKFHFLKLPRLRPAAHSCFNGKIQFAIEHPFDFVQPRPLRHVIASLSPQDFPEFHAICRQAASCWNGDNLMAVNDRRVVHNVPFTKSTGLKIAEDNQQSAPLRT